MSHPVFPICQKLILFFRFFSQTPHFCHMSRPRFCHMSEINSFFSSKAHFPRRTHRPSHTSHARPILSVSLPLSLSTRQVTQARVDRRRRHHPSRQPQVSGKEIYLENDLFLQYVGHRFCHIDISGFNSLTKKTNRNRVAHVGPFSNTCWARWLVFIDIESFNFNYERPFVDPRGKKCTLRKNRALNGPFHVGPTSTPRR